ncbi:hypothetical protein TNCV_3091241 [Trichonephila clavipes]|uniref:Uncharacterized protein n=1 Tax=Trichonephila clavipes TaxID=2585209 RepID=A0A8X6W8C3_TRICX|nr:hypothetical protein TNCV_3091241 [Trichonephila clavipes]
MVRRLLYRIDFVGFYLQCCAKILMQMSSELDLHSSQHETMHLVPLNPGQGLRMTPETAFPSPNFHTSPTREL